MNNEYVCGTEDLLRLFLKDVSVADVIAAKTLSEISSTIVKNRISLEMTQEDFAEFLGVSQSMVSKWESEDYNFSIKGLAQIAEKLDLDLKVRLYKKKVRNISNNIRQYSVISSEENNFYVISNRTSEYNKYIHDYKGITCNEEDFYQIYKEG